MTLALFGIENDGLNLAVNLLVFFLVVIWVALVYWTYSDATRRLDDPMLVGSATAASLFPFIGTIVYTIVRPPEYLEDRHERELEIKAAEKRLALLENRTCRNCGARSIPATCAVRTARASSRSRARAAASRWTRAGACAPTARRRSPAPCGRAAIRAARAARAPRTEAGKRAEARRRAEQRDRSGRAERADVGRPSATTRRPHERDRGRARRAGSRPATHDVAAAAQPVRSRADMSRTLILVKPDAFERNLTGEVIARFERKGLRIAALKLMRVDRELAEKHYTSTRASRSSRT